MRRPALLLAIFLAGGCGGDDERVTETITVTTATTVTVTETTTVTGQAPTTTAPAASAWSGLSFPLPEDGSLPVDQFNAYAETVDEPWERDLAGVMDAFVEAGAGDACSRSFQATSSGDSATATLTLEGLMDDSVRAQRYELDLGRRDDGTWKVESASWAQRCHEGRGHQDFSPEPCL
jgi:hypothetical protein